MTTRLIVAIDGPAGAGKSTIARLLAERLGVPYFNTGAMYRALALYAIENDMPMEAEALVDGLKRCGLDLQQDGVETRVFLGERDVTADVRGQAVGEAASHVSVFPLVRDEMVARQREMGLALGGVIEGRDIATVVFPDARCKFFLTAGVDERARRRYEELRAKGKEASLEAVRKEVEDRDRRDTEREVAPLQVAPGAVVVDTTGRGTSEVLEILLQYIDDLR